MVERKSPVISPEEPLKSYALYPSTAMLDAPVMVASKDPI